MGDSIQFTPTIDVIILYRLKIILAIATIFNVFSMMQYDA